MMAREGLHLLTGAVYYCGYWCYVRDVSYVLGRRWSSGRRRYGRCRSGRGGDTVEGSRCTAVTDDESLSRAEYQRTSPASPPDSDYSTFTPTEDEQVSSISLRVLSDLCIVITWLNGSVVSALGIRARGPRFESRVVPLFHWVATLPPQFLGSKKLG